MISRRNPSASMESTRRNSNRINGGGHDAGLGMGVITSTCMGGGRLGGSKKDRWRAQAELQGILGAGTRLVRLRTIPVILIFCDRGPRKMACMEFLNCRSKPPQTAYRQKAQGMRGVGLLQILRIFFKEACTQKESCWRKQDRRFDSFFCTCRPTRGTGSKTGSPLPRFLHFAKSIRGP